MSRIDFHRPARVACPQLPTNPVVLAAPPQPVGRDGGASWLYLLMPLLSSFSVAGYMIVAGKKALIFLGIGFVLISVGVTLSVRMSMRGKQRKVRIRARDLYVQHLAEVRRTARQVAEDQRVVAAWASPSPYRLWAIATDRRRVWERRLTDPDFLKVCVGVGQAPLCTPIRLATRNDPTIEYDNRAKAAADRLIATMSTVGSQPAMVDLAEAGVVSVLGTADVARGTVRAMLCQIAVLHAPDDVAVIIATGGEDWEWAKWLPHTHDFSGSAGVGSVPLVAEEFEGIADQMREALEAAARRPDRRSLLFGRGEPEHAAPPGRRTRPLRPAGGVGALAAGRRTARLGRTGQRDHRDLHRRNAKKTSRPVPTCGCGSPRTARSPSTVGWPTAAAGSQRHRRRLAGTCALRSHRARAGAAAPVGGERGDPRPGDVAAQHARHRDLDTLEPRDLWVEADDEAVLQLPVGFDSGGQPARAGPQGGGAGRNGTARADRRRYRLGQERTAAHPGHRPFGQALARPAQLRPGGLQGRRDLRRSDRAAARGRDDHQPGRRPGPGRPGQGRAGGRAAAAPADPA